MSRPTTADDEGAVSRDDRTASDEPPQAEGDVLIDECVSPDVCDERGHLRAAAIFEWMDVIGALAATRYGRLTSVPLAIDGCDVIEPVALGARVAMRGRVVYASRRTLGVAITMSVSGRGDAVLRPVLNGYMTFVFVDSDGELVPVVPIAPQTPEQLALHREGDMRRQFHRELSRDRSVLTRPELLLVGAIGETRRDGGVYYLLRELGSRLATRRRRTGAGVRSPDTSYIHRIEPVRGGKSDGDGAPHGGTFMRWIETCAAMSAGAFVDAPVRLVGVHGIAFQRPVPGNAFVHLYGVAVHSDDDGVTVHVTATAENPLTGDTLDVMRGFVTYAPTDGDVPVPAVARPGPEEAALFCEVSLRKALRDRLASLHRPPRR